MDRVKTRESYTPGIMPPSHNIDILIKAGKWQKLLPNWEDVCEKAVEAVLESQNIVDRPIELSIVLANDALVQHLNKKYRDQDLPTNVLSFPTDNFHFNPFLPQHLGDMVLAFETCHRELQDNENITEFADLICHLVVHSVLHLLGYKHDVKADAIKMENLEINILANLGVGNPYL